MATNKMKTTVCFLLFMVLLARSSLALSETEALLKVKEGLDKAETLATWTTGSSPCQAKWAGVMCFNGIITGLHLTGMGLSGSIDVEALLQIRGLRTVSLINNTFTGPIPDFSRIGVLKALLLSGNSFSGEIPDDFFSHLNSLKKVWLDANKFSGKIPSSLAKLKNLLELHLESNQFSGKIPEFTKPIPSLDLSNNLLEGPIPAVFEPVDGAAFIGNEKLCGKPVKKACPDGSAANDAASSEAEVDMDRQKSNNVKLIWVGILIAMIVVVLYACLSSKRSDDDGLRDFSHRNNAGHMGETPYISYKTTNRAVSARAVSPEESKNNYNNNYNNSNTNNSNKSSPGEARNMTDLIMVNEERGISFGLSDLMKAAAEVLGNGGLGSAYKAVMTSGVSVAVKRMREMNRLGRDGFDAEMRRFGRIRHRNILTPLAYHYRREEKLLVSEYIPKGSLLYVLHGDRGSVHAELSWEIRLKIAKGVARGLGFLYSEFSTLELPHGNLKSSNVLLGEDNEPLLSDYAFQPLMNPPNAAQAMFAYRTPDNNNNNNNNNNTSNSSPNSSPNYRVSRKTDVYCLGLIVLEILTGKFPSQYLSNGKGGTDVVNWALEAAGSEESEDEMLDPDMLATAGPASVAQMRALLRVGAACVEPNPHLRIDIREAIARIDQVRAA